MQPEMYSFVLQILLSAPMFGTIVTVAVVIGGVFSAPNTGISQPLSADQQPLGKAFLAILDIDRGSITKLENPLGFAWGLPLQWTPDGRAVAYVKMREGISNIWRLPLDGTAATPITHFDSGQQLLRFAFSGMESNWHWSAGRRSAMSS